MLKASVFRRVPWLRNIRRFSLLPSAEAPRRMHGPLEPLYSTQFAEVNEKLNRVSEAQRLHAAAPVSRTDASAAVGRWLQLASRLTHTSNALEGNLLSFSRVHQLVVEADTLSPSAAASDDEADIIAHAQGVEVLLTRLVTPADGKGMAVKPAPITTRALLALHSVAIPASRHNERGKWRSDARVTAASDAEGRPSMLRYPAAYFAGEETAELLAKVAQVEQQMRDAKGAGEAGDGRPQAHPVALAAMAHYNLARAHPFGDGNGRMSRLLTNWLLLRHRYMPCIIEAEERPRYLAALQAADHKRTLAPLIDLVADGVLRTIAEFPLEATAVRSC